MELPNIAAYAYQDVHVWSALLTCLRPLLSARARQGTWLHKRALPHAWGAVMRALLGNRPASCQLLPVRTHKPPQGNRSANGPGMVRHATGHAEAAAGGAGPRSQRHAWLAAAAE